MKRYLIGILRYLFYTHERIGKNGKPFRMYKFRTMVSNSDELLDYVERVQGRDARGKIVGDMRLTTFGKFLKKHRVDEFPQLINVLKGEMMLVGPRPHSERFARKWVPEDLPERRLLVKPGLFKPMMAYCDYDEGGLEFVTERKFLEDYLQAPFRTQCRYLLRILLPPRFKWQLIPGGRVYTKKDFYTKRTPRL